MFAELNYEIKNDKTEIIFEKLKEKFPLNGFTIQDVINNSYLKDSEKTAKSFKHAHQQSNFILLFSNSGDDITIQIECPQSKNELTSLKTRITNLTKNIDNIVTNQKIDTKKVNAYVIIFSEGTEIITGKKSDKNKEFFDELKKQLRALVFIPLSVLIISVIFKQFDLIKDYKSALINVLSSILGIIIWYFFEYFSFNKNQTFKYEIL